MITFRVRHITHGTHVYCRIFSAESGGTMAHMGSLTMTLADFKAFRETFPVEYIEENPSAE